MNSPPSKPCDPSSRRLVTPGNAPGTPQEKHLTLRLWLNTKRNWIDLAREAQVWLVTWVVQFELDRRQARVDEVLKLKAGIA